MFRLSSEEKLTAKEELDIFLGQIDDYNPDNLRKLIEAHVEEEHLIRCGDCNPKDAGFCDNCDERRSDEPRRNEGYE